MTLTNAMDEAPAESEVSAFRTFVARLMSFHRKLYIPYHTDTLLRDLLLTTTDIPSIQTTLRDRIPLTRHQAVNRISNQLSDESISAGSSVACLFDDGYENEERTESNSLGKTFGGAARGDTKTPWRPAQHGRRPIKGRPFRKRLKPRWMRGVKGCFVCRQGQMENTCHTRKGVTKVIIKMK